MFVKYNSFADCLDQNTEYEPNTGCWLWSGSWTPHGYGRASFRRITRLAHRVAFEIHNGVSLLSREFVCHSCDTPACINPAHLWLGSQGDNMRDMARKYRGRTSSQAGESNNRAKLTESDVLRARAMRANGHTTKQIATLFGVTVATARKAVAGESWGHI